MRLKIATLQKPAGYVEPANAPKPETESGGRGGVVVVKVPGHGDIFVGEGSAEQTPVTEAYLLRLTLPLYEGVFPEMASGQFVQILRDRKSVV